MNTSTYQDPRITAAAERQMRTWSRIEEIAANTEHGHPRDGEAQGQYCYVTISRECGAGGAAVGQLVGERLRWEVYGRNLLDQVAQRYKESRLMLDLVDETRGNWVFDVLGTWMDRHIITHEKFVAQVTRMIQLLARSGNAVFIGRGGQFLLPRKKTFAVRIVASEAHRVERVAERMNVTSREALAVVRRTDRGRREFIRRYFRHDLADPRYYDMVLNTEKLGVTGAAEQILFALRQAHAAEQAKTNNLAESQLAVRA